MLFGMIPILLDTNSVVTDALEETNQKASLPLIITILLEKKSSREHKAYTKIHWTWFTNDAFEKRKNHIDHAWMNKRRNHKYKLKV